MKTPGYIAVTAGVIHLIKCIPVDYWVRQDTEYHELWPSVYQWYTRTNLISLHQDSEY